MTLAEWVVPIGSLMIAALSLVTTVVLRWLDHQRDLDKTRFGVVYQERFRVCKELYTRLSRLRDAVEAATNVEMPNKAEELNRLDKRADDFRRSYRQNDVILDQAVADSIDKTWVLFKKTMYAYSDSVAGKGGNAYSLRCEVLAALDASRAELRNAFRREFGMA